ncbi:hypothetical protein AYI70_g3683 [Smittium culicis]|uniref:Micro-fibrillar-associated protein 1 C-terminal domain-containing protein n=1 Tax=Smittium culicis TaxID=133412 RepID=A0A1R1Y2H5_9FUNG|nr:hypothetical protein AYI70_g3683 [Smittium culicis]
MNFNSLSKKSGAKSVATSGTKVARYFPGKAPAINNDTLYSDYSENSDSETESKIESSNVIDAKDKNRTNSIGDVEIPTIKRFGLPQEENVDISELAQKRLAARKRALSDSDSSSESEKDANTSEDEDQSRIDRLKIRQKLSLRQDFSATEDESSSQESEDSEGDSSEESSEYESDNSITKMRKPVFVSRQQRKTKISKITNMSNTEIVEDEEYFEEQEKRRVETLRIAALQAEANQKVDITDIADTIEAVDDTDGLDEDAEYELWKVRERFRINRDAAKRAEMEEESEEMQKRRSMTDKEIMEADRDKYDKLAKMKNDRQALNKNTQNHHMGAFFTDILESKSVTEKYSAKIKVDQGSRSQNDNNADIPAILKSVRERNFGRSSQTKWKGLSSEDTSKQAIWQDVNKRRKY